MHKIVDGIEVPLTQAEIDEFNLREAEWLSGETDRKLAQIREKRNKLIAETDFRMLPDYQGSDAEQWAIYRQALRDITKQDITNIQWPEKPVA